MPPSPVQPAGDDDEPVPDAGQLLCQENFSQQLRHSVGRDWKWRVCEGKGIPGPDLQTV